MNILAPLVPDPGFKNYLKKKADTGQPREYRKYEFCEAKKCEHFYIRVTGQPHEMKELPRCDCGGDCCFYTAKEFHHWLKDNGFRIVKEVE